LISNTIAASQKMCMTTLLMNRASA